MVVYESCVKCLKSVQNIIMKLHKNKDIWAHQKYAEQVKQLTEN